jgi:hypothetical protein
MYCYSEPSNHFASFHWSNAVGAATESEAISYAWNRSDINSGPAASKPPACPCIRFCHSSVAKFARPVTTANLETQAAKYQTFLCPESTVDIAKYETTTNRQHATGWYISLCVHLMSSTVDIFMTYKKGRSP